MLISDDRDDRCEHSFSLSNGEFHSNSTHYKEDTKVNSGERKIYIYIIDISAFCFSSVPNGE